MLSKVIKFGVATVCALAPAVAAQSGHTGIYVGAEGGASLWRVKSKADEQNTISFSEDSSSENKAVGRVGGVVGAGKAFNSGIYVGAQIGAGASFGSFKHEGQNVKSELKPVYYYNADVRFGYVVNPGCLVYVSGGFEGQATKLTAEFALFSSRVEIGKDDRTHVPYGTVGLGFRYQFSNGLFVGCEAKAMFGAKTTWKLKMDEGSAATVNQEIKNLTQIKTKVAERNLTDADCQNAFKTAQSYGLFQGYTLDGMSLKLDGNLIRDEEQQKLFEGALAEMDKILEGWVKIKEVDGRFKQKTRLQNYAFTVSIGYRF